jgi:hypothetical protein
MTLPKSALKAFKDRLTRWLRQPLTGQAQQACQAAPDLRRDGPAAGNQPRARTAVQSPSAVQIALMQRMGVTGRPLMDACKRRQLSR